MSTPSHPFFPFHPYNALQSQSSSFGTNGSAPKKAIEHIVSTPLDPAAAHKRQCTSVNAAHRLPGGEAHRNLTEGLHLSQSRRVMVQKWDILDQTDTWHREDACEASAW